MDEDIDIEEHDLLDNPALRNIFPDLSVIKKEIFDNYEGIVKKEAIHSEIEVKESDKNISITCNNIKEPPAEDCTVVENSLNNEISENNDPLPSKESVKFGINNCNISSNIKSNRIILGSRPQVKVVLEDVYPYLMKSKRFCNKCFILFSDITCLNKHEHSKSNLTKDNSKSQFMCNICNKSYLYEAELNKHIRQTHRNKSDNNKLISATVNVNHECDKCGAKYKLRKSLIQHFQKKHPSPKNKKNKNSVKECGISQEGYFKKRTINNKPEIHNEVIKSKRKLIPVKILKRKNDPRECELCGISCATNFILKKHMENHKKNVIHKNINFSKNKEPSIEINDDKEVTNTCFHCKDVFEDQQTYIEHLYNVLQDQKYSKIEEKTENDDVCDSDEFNKSRKEFMRCPNCFYYFKYMQVYVAHMIRKHKVEKVPVVNLVDYEDKCYFCGQRFQNFKQYNLHMQKMHCDKINKHDRALVDEESRDENNAVLLACKLCFKIFENPSLLSRHYLFKHKLNAENASKELNSNKAIVSQPQLSQLPIFTSVLFKCNKCDVHFMFAKCATNHVKHMDMLINWKCSTCFRIFKKEDEVLHSLQHSINEGNLTIHNLCESQLHNILFKCPKCAVHFNEDNYLCHYVKCGIEIGNSSYCEVCDILIDEEAINSHKKSHLVPNSSLTDFVFVETDIYSGKNVETDKKHGKAVVRKTELFYCDCCKCFITGLSKSECHLERKCKEITKYICQYCGLLLTQKTHQESHKNYHKNDQKFVLQDVIFFDLRNGKQIAPPLPDFPKCHGCGVNFVRKNSIKQSHDCGTENFVTCHICRGKFTDAAYKLHIAFHNYSLDKSSKISSSGTFSRESNENVIQDVLEGSKSKLNVNSEVPTDEKYPIYNCYLCRIAFDCYDKVVEHCQAHFVKEVYKYFPTKYCEICDLEYDAQCYEKHYENHISNKIENMRLLNFDLDFFLQDNGTWQKHVFTGFSRRERFQFIAESIYRHETKVKFTVIQDGPYKLTVYKCDSCNCFVDRGSLVKHAKNCCSNLTKHPCSICGLPFVSNVSKQEHEKIHSYKEIEITKHSFRIILFNRAEDKILNDALSKRKKYVLHECRKCNVVVNIQKYNDHICKNSKTIKCKECGLIFQSDDYEIHSLKHQHCSDYNQRNMKLLLCGQKTPSTLPKKDFKGVVHDYTFYQCPDCLACMKNNQSVTHDCTSKYFCHDCDLSFANKGHITLHKNDPDFVKFNVNLVRLETISKKCEIIDVDDRNNLAVIRKSSTEVDDSEGKSLPKIKQINVYKCACDLHFFEVSVITSHLSTCNARVRSIGQKCSKCELVLTPKLLFNHVLKHHGSKTVTYKYKIIDVCRKENVLYKCDKCVLHFLTYANAYEHVENCKKILTNSKQCEVCELHFVSTDLSDHKIRHTLSPTTDLLIRQVVVNEHVDGTDDSEEMGSILSECLALSKQQLSRMDLSKYSNVLYKCKNCNYLALDQMALACHLLSDFHVVNNLETCKKCDYSFPLSSLTIHVYVHHKKWNLSKNDLIVQEYDDLIC